VSLSRDRLSACSAGERSTQHLQHTATHDRVVDCDHGGWQVACKREIQSNWKTNEEQLQRSTEHELSQGSGALCARMLKVPPPQRCYVLADYGGCCSDGWHARASPDLLVTVKNEIEWDHYSNSSTFFFFFFFFFAFDSSRS
jgi:hypothetical protein